MTYSEYVTSYVGYVVACFGVIDRMVLVREAEQDCAFLKANLLRNFCGNFELSP